MTSNGAGRSVSHNTFGDYAQIIQGDFNVSVHPPKKALELDYLHEATFNATNKQHAPGCLENTRVQVLDQIRSWIDDDGEERLYWLRGMAGTGKTTISMTIAREYYRKGRLGASFFFSRSSGDLSSTRKFVATIANELAELSPAYREHLHKALESSPSITSRSLYDQWEKLILDPLRSTLLEDDVQPILIVIDALDECGSEHDLGVLIQCLADLAALEKIPFRIFITSRPEKTIHQGFDRIISTSRQDFTLHDIEESIVAADLRLYYRHELNGMDIDASLITEETIDILAKKSGGLFIHAATVCRFIQQGEIYAATRLSSFIASQDSQLEPERELDSIYTTILENAFAKFATLRPGEMKTLQLSYQKVVGSVVMLYDRMSPADFAIMVAIASVSEGHGVSAWDTRFPTKHTDSEFTWDYPSIVAASRDDMRFASASYGDAIRLWDGQTGAKRELYIHRLRPLIDMLSDTRWLKKLMSRFKKPAFPGFDFEGRKKLNISSITFSMDGKFFACVWKTKKLQVWDAQNGKMLFARKLDSSTSDNVVFSPDSKVIATVSDKIYFWNTIIESEAYSSEAPLGRVESISFSPNGKYLVSSIPTDDEETTDDEEIEPSVYDNGDFYGYTHISVSVEYDSLFQFSSNSKLLAYPFSDRTLVLNVETREFVHTFKKHPSNLVKLSIFHDSRFLGALHSMGNVLIWDLVTGATVHTGGIGANESSLCFSLDGKHIASLDKIFAYKSSMSANCHSAGISFTGAWIKDGGQDIVYFPHEFKDLYDFMAGNALVFGWPPTSFFREAVQYLGCNMLQFAMVEKVMDDE